MAAVKVDNYETAYSWLKTTASKHQKSGELRPHLFLGNGFSMAYDSERFGYGALADTALDQSLIPPLARKLMDATGTKDFEAVMKRLYATATSLKIIDPVANASLVETLLEEVDAMREVLAQSIAGLHPDRPDNVTEDGYLAVRKFLDCFGHVYTVNYDLLLYWCLMHDFPDLNLKRRASDDGFRDSGIDGDDTVLWDMYDPHGQDVYYMHGALHLYLGDDGLRKLTWARTGDALLDQIRLQLQNNRYPLYVSEGTSMEKMARISDSAYLSRGIRSLTACGGSLLVFGHSLDENDDHLLEAIVRGSYKRMAVSLYGDAGNPVNTQIVRRANALVVRRGQRKDSRTALEVSFFDAETVPLWWPDAISQ